jgi:prefoldin subunit 5
VLGSTGIAPAPSSADGTPEMDSSTLRALDTPHSSSENVGEMLQAEKEKIERAIEQQNKLLEDLRKRLQTQEDSLKQHVGLVQKLKVEQETRNQSKDADIQNRDKTVAGELAAIKTKVQEIDDTMLKIKQLWVHFDERIKTLETFSSGLLAVAETDPLMGANDAQPSGNDSATDTGNGNTPDGNPSKRTKRKR